MKEGLKAIKLLDIPIFLSLLFVAVFSFFAIYALQDEEANVVVQYGDKEWVYPLNQDGEFEIEGAIGITKFIIKNKEVSVVDSPCPNKTCIASWSIKKVGDWNACLPNKVFLYIKKR